MITLSAPMLATSRRRPEVLVPAICGVALCAQLKPLRRPRFRWRRDRPV
jgi:hypothetical protein